MKTHHEVQYKKPGYQLDLIYMFYCFIMYLYYVPWLNLISWFYYHNMPLKETNNLHPSVGERAGGNIKPQEKHTSSIKPLVLELQVLLVHQPILSSVARVDLMICNNGLCQHVKVNHIPFIETSKRQRGSGKSWALHVQSRRYLWGWCHRTATTSPQVQLSLQGIPKCHLPPVVLSESLLL